MVETVIVFTVAAITVGAAAMAVMPWLSREEMRSATYETQTFVQLARMEALQRNRDTRMIVNPETKTFEILDTKGTSSGNDDSVLHRMSLPSGVDFAHPETGKEPITLEQISGTASFQSVFSSDGILEEGAGTITLRGSDEDYVAVVVQWAGGAVVNEWQADASSWTRADAVGKVRGTADAQNAETAPTTTMAQVDYDYYHPGTTIETGSGQAGVTYTTEAEQTGGDGDGDDN